MARKKRSSFNPVWIILAAALILVGIIGAQFFGKTGGEPYRTTELLDVESYLENSNSLRGNVYRIEGEVVNALAWSPTGGRLIAVSVEDNSEVIPVLVPTSFNDINIQKGQRFVFMLEVDDKGMLRTRNLTKA